MNETKFKLHTDCDYPCIHLEVYLDGELISNSEVDIESQINYIDNNIINEYNSLLDISISNKCNEFKNMYNSPFYRNKIREIEILFNKKNMLEKALNERDNNV